MSRATYVVLALGTIAVGLLVHRATSGLDLAMRDVLGDALWAAMMLWWVSAAAPNARLVSRLAAAFGICVLVELSQFIHAPFIETMRLTTLGHLVLGSDFDPRDLAAYALGVSAAALLEWVVLRRRLSPA